MTFERGKLPLMANPEAVAHAVYRAVGRGRNTIYTPWFWRLIMMVIRALPERVMSKMNF
jgi:short-subunit dehydrogenase